VESLGKMRIMLVDDNAYLLECMERILSALGYAVSTYDDPQDAVQAYCRTGFDLVITDMKMPEMNGLELLRALRRHNPEAIVLVVTGCDDSLLLEEAEKSGAYTLFKKPVDLEVLIDCLRNIEHDLRNGAVVGVSGELTA
jgi:DNA-binding NtrC family response regulator